MREFKVQYRGIDYIGPKTCRGRVTGKRIEDGTGLVDVELGLEDESGNVTTPATATVELPLRASFAKSS
jgi:hypothetical protein